MLSLVIPCFNEEKSIPILVSNVSALLKEHEAEVILVDNGSVDDTQEVLKSALAQVDNPRLKAVKVEKNVGYGYGILYGLTHASGDALAWTHADLQTDIADVFKAYELYKKQGGAVFVKGKRKNRRFAETFFTFGMQIAAFFFLKTWLSDINAQPKLFSREFYEEHIREKAPRDFSLDLYALYMAKRSGQSLNTIPVYFKNRLYGEAKGGGGSWQNRVKLVKRTFKYILELSKIVDN